ncbi:TPA: hypothetical protein N0F65_011097 [Lagenidium giganteum]|uniref:Uncharacterized protein n=1 Tax=Lagenidium giganteum TaxID=4803 RepID=A0AAV2ZIB3_9STRA|nr:TPA: hypothetical protein N0F65_011097 [Lagenidium giganteum]
MDELAAIGAMVLTLKRRLEDVSLAHDHRMRELMSEVQRRFRRVNANVKRIAAQWVVREAHDDMSENRPTTLSKRPTDLCAGNKPAKLFTARERGGCKFTYSLRLNFWRLVEAMTRRGHTSDMAIDTIYATYGRSLAVTAILHAMLVVIARSLNPLQFYPIRTRLYAPFESLSKRAWSNQQIYAQQNGAAGLRFSVAPSSLSILPTPRSQHLSRSHCSW